MRERLWTVMFVGIWVCGSTLGIAERLRALDDSTAVDVDALLAGALHTLYFEPATWWAAPRAITSWACWLELLRHPEAWISAVGLVTLVAVGARRQAPGRPELHAGACLASAVVPWSACAYRLHCGVDPTAAGAWLARMLSVALAASLACIVLAGRGLSSWSSLADPCLRPGRPSPGPTTG